MLIKNLLYIFQAEQYVIARFLRYVYTHPYWWKLQKRGKVVWTAKVKALWVLSWALFAFALLISLYLSGWRGVLIGIALLALLPFIIVFASLLLKPLDWYLKRQLLLRARQLLEQKKPLIVGITGSYGKTTAKELAAAVLSEKFKVLKTPENVNTNLGIAQFVLANLRNHEVLVVEMAAHYPGDIERICWLTPPHYGMLTGINETHLERFGSLSAIVREKFVLPSRTKVFAALNFDDARIRANYHNFALGNFAGFSRQQVGQIKYRENFGGCEFEVAGEKFFTPLLAAHNITLILLVVGIARKMGLSTAQIKRGIAKVKPLPHRLQPIYNATTNIWILDDSYNANPDGIRSGIEVLSRAQGRKIVLTPGIVELGRLSAKIHRRIGKLYAARTDLVLLIRSEAAEYIRQGMEESNFKNYKIYPSASAAHADLKNILRPGDTIIFQNDLPDIYA
jgi:UDP-N-acetylmuramoyl-tripeptide--D-alanyl-D-alanine ligase